MSQEKAKRNPNWTRNELILALDFYLQRRGSIPNKDSQSISDLQMRIHRAAVQAVLSGDHRFRNRNGVYMKLMNFRRFDRTLSPRGGSGLDRGGKLEEVVWAELANNTERCHRLAQEIASAN
jgi:5-methylcytosine-specific restriction protein A